MNYFISYFSTLMMNFALTSEDKNGATESKCQSFFPLEIIVELLELSKYVWELRKSIIIFYYHVYLDAE